MNNKVIEQWLKVNPKLKEISEYTMFVSSEEFFKLTGGEKITVNNKEISVSFLQKIMTIFEYIIYTLFFCIAPAGVIWACRRYKALEKVGPIMVLYAIGMVVGNLPFLPEGIKALQDMIPNVMIPLAIPMMLFGCTFKTSEISLQVRIITSGVLSVAIAVVAGYLIFSDGMEQSAEIGGMLAGKCTGGTLNAAALKEGLGISSEKYVLITTYDIVICFFYFVFLLGGGIRLFRWC